MMSATRMIHTRIYRVFFIHYLPKDVTVWPIGRVSIVDIGEILHFNDVGLLLRIGFEDGYYERIS